MNRALSAASARPIGIPMQRIGSMAQGATPTRTGLYRPRPFLPLRPQRAPSRYHIPPLRFDGQTPQRRPPALWTAMLDVGAPHTKAWACPRRRPDRPFATSGGSTPTPDLHRRGCAMHDSVARPGPSNRWTGPLRCPTRSFERAVRGTAPRELTCYVGGSGIPLAVEPDRCARTNPHAPSCPGTSPLTLAFGGCFPLDAASKPHVCPLPAWVSSCLRVASPPRRRPPAVRVPCLPVAHSPVPSGRPAHADGGSARRRRWVVFAGWMVDRCDRLWLLGKPTDRVQHQDGTGSSRATQTTVARGARRAGSRDCGSVPIAT